MKVLVIGGTGLIGSKVVARLRAKGHDVVAASPSSGVNTLTGEGLDAAMAGVDTVVDLANSPSFAPDDVMHFFTTAGRNIVAAEKKAGVKLHVALSIVGTDRVPGNGYFAGKVAQEKLIRESGVPYSIVRSTQFMEFTKGIADERGASGTIRVSTGGIQPIAAEDVGEALAAVVLEPAHNGIVEIGGPASYPMADLVRRYLTVVNDPRVVEDDPSAPYYGAPITWDSLLPGPNARLGKTTLDAWLSANVPAAHAV